MNKRELVDAIAFKTGLQKTKAEAAVNAFIEVVIHSVEKGEPVRLAGFGAFSTKARSARVRKNPNTGEDIECPAKTVPAFKPGNDFVEAVKRS